MEINIENMRALRTAFNASFNEGFAAEVPGLDAWLRFTEDVISETGDEEYGWLEDIPAPRVWEGDRHLLNTKLQSYRLVEKPYERTIVVGRRPIETDRYGIFKKRFDLLGKGARRHPASLMYGALAAGFTTPCFDGQYFFDTDHPVGSGVVSNMQAGAGNPWYLLDVTNFLKPLILQRAYREFKFEAKEDAAASDHVFNRDEFVYGIRNYMVSGYGFWQMAFGSKADLTTENFDLAYDSMMGFKNAFGEPLGVTPGLLVCGPSRRKAAEEILLAERDAFGATNTNRGKVELLVVPFLP